MEEAIVLGIGINDATDRAMLGGNFGLDAAPVFAIARDYDCPLDGNPQTIELLVIFAVAVVYIDQRGGHVSVDGIRVIGGQLLRDLIGSRIARDSRLLQLGSELSRLDHFDGSLFRRREKHLEGFNAGVKSPLFELGQDPVRILLVVGRAHVVRTRSQTLHVLTQVFRDDASLEFLLPVALCLRGLRRVASQTGSPGGRGLRRLRKSEMSSAQHCETCNKT